MNLKGNSLKRTNYIPKWSSLGVRNFLPPLSQTLSPTPQQFSKGQRKENNSRVPAGQGATHGHTASCFQGISLSCEGGLLPYRDCLELRRLRCSHDGRQPHPGPISTPCPRPDRRRSQPCSLCAIPHQPLFSARVPQPPAPFPSSSPGFEPPFLSSPWHNSPHGSLPYLTSQSVPSAYQRSQDPPPTREGPPQALVQPNIPQGLNHHQGLSGTEASALSAWPGCGPLPSPAGNWVMAALWAPGIQGHWAGKYHINIHQ